MKVTGLRTLMKAMNLLRKMHMGTHTIAGMFSGDSGCTEVHPSPST